MRRIRQRLSSLIGLWLLCQLAAFAAPAAVCCGETPISRDASAQHICCMGGSGGGPCPMHRQAARRGCVIKGACSAADAALLSLAGGIGMLPPQGGALSDAPVYGALVVGTHVPVTRNDRPESPPPRR